MSSLGNKVLITCATGKTASQIIPILRKHKFHIRAFCHSEQSAKKLVPDAQLETFTGRLESSDDLARAVKGVDRVIHIGPPFHSQETAIGTAMIDAARAEGIQQFLYVSVLHPTKSKLVNHKAKAIVEEYLQEAKFRFYTILQPTHFMQGTNVSSVVEQGSFQRPYNLDNLQGFVDLRDVALVAAQVMLHPEYHDKATYELLGENATNRRFAETIASESGKSVQATEVPLPEFVQNSPFNGSAYAKDGASRLFLYYDTWGLTGSPNVLRWLLAEAGVKSGPSNLVSYVKHELGKK